MSANLSDKLDLNINWAKATFLALGSTLFFATLGAILKMRLLFVLADLIIFGFIIFSLAVFTASLIKSRAKPNDSHEK